MVISVKTQLYNLQVFFLSLAATCFGHLFGHLQSTLEIVCFFLFTLLHLQYIYTYTTTTTVMRDLSSCSVCKKHVATSDKNKNTCKL
jgi:hypothetical protein